MRRFQKPKVSNVPNG